MLFHLYCSSDCWWLMIDDEQWLMIFWSKRLLCRCLRMADDRMKRQFAKDYNILSDPRRPSTDGVDEKSDVAGGAPWSPWHQLECSVGTRQVRCSFWGIWPGYVWIFQIWFTGWWFQTFFIFHNIWDNPSHWLFFFKMLKTTNQFKM